MMNRKTLTLGLAGLATFLALNSIIIVQQTEQALVLEFGKHVRTIKEPGLHWKKPFIQDAVYIDNRLLDFNAEPKEVVLGDQKRLIVDAFVRYRITNPLRFYETVREERIMRDRLNSIVESSLRQVMGIVPLNAVLSSRRSDILRSITEIVNSQASGTPLQASTIERLKKHQAEDATNVEEAVAEVAPQEAVGAGFGVEVVDVRIMRADLPPENSEAIYRRMQTEREREAKEFRAKGEEEAQKIRARADQERTVILANAQRDADIIRGEGEAAASKTYAGAYGQDAEFSAFYRSLQAYRTTLNPKDTTMVLSPKSEFLRYLEQRTAVSQ